MIKRMLPAWAFLTLASSAQALQAPALFNHETVMDSTYQAHGRSTLQTAPVRYLDEGHQQGYASGGQIEIIGRARRFVLDHPRADSDLSIVDHYRKRLRAAGYLLAFECHRRDCGDAAGWRLLLGDGVVGDNYGQHYLLAHKGQRAERGDYVAVYINEVDDLPRSVVQSVEYGHLESLRSLPVEAEEHRFFYSINGTHLSLRDRLDLGRVAATLRDDPDMSVGITGFADGAGSDLDETNQSLARRRADAVASVLAEQLTEPGRVVNHGGRVRTPENGEPAGQWRRVDLSLQRAEHGTGARIDTAPSQDDVGGQANQTQGDHDDDSNPA